MMTNVFAVVGQAIADPGRLLLLGEDGRFYAYAADGQLRPTELAEAWRLDSEGAEPGAEPGSAIPAAESTSRSPAKTSQ